MNGESSNDDLEVVAWPPTGLDRVRFVLAMLVLKLAYKLIPEVYYRAVDGRLLRKIAHQKDVALFEEGDE